MTLGGSGNDHVEVLNGKLNEITFGDHSFYDMPFVLTSLTYLQAVYNTSINGILGYHFLSRGRIIINFKKKTLTMYFYKEAEE